MFLLSKAFPRKLCYDILPEISTRLSRETPKSMCPEMIVLAQDVRRLNVILRLQTSLDAIEEQLLLRLREAFENAWKASDSADTDRSVMPEVRDLGRMNIPTIERFRMSVGRNSNSAKDAAPFDLRMIEVAPHNGGRIYTDNTLFGCYFYERRNPRSGRVLRARVLHSRCRNFAQR